MSQDLLPAVESPMREGNTVIEYTFDEAMCGAEFTGDLDAVAAFLTAQGYPSRAHHDSYNGAPSEARQAEQGALIPPDKLFFEAVAKACE